MPAKPIAGMALGVPPAPIGTRKPTDTIASRLLRDSAASGRRGISYGAETSPDFIRATENAAH
jgi:hypothetical protein